jgi:DNA-binding MarR family transcriptional regulator
MSNLPEVLKSLNRIEQLLVLLTKAYLAPVLQKEFADPRMLQLYELTGTHGQREIKKKLNMSANTISDAWKRWERLGLLTREGQEYRRVL